MTIYNENSATRLTTGATDADSDPISVRRINGVIPNGWPYSFAVAGRQFLAYENGSVVYDDLGDQDSHPADGATQSVGSYTYTLWDGRDESDPATVTVTFAGVAPDPVEPSDEVQGYIAKWTAAGLSDATWTDEANSLALTATGSPEAVTSPSGGEWVEFEAGEGFFGADTGAAMPLGDDPRTVIFVGAAQPQSGGAAFGGITYGSNTPGGSFGFLINGNEHSLDVNFVGDYVAGPSVNAGAPFIAITTYDGDDLNYYFGKTLISTEEIALTTQSGSLRVMRNATGSAYRPGHVAAIYVYDEALSEAEVFQMVDYLNETYVADLLDPVVSSATLTAVSPTSLQAKATGNKGGMVWGAVTTSAATPDWAWIKANATFTSQIPPGGGEFTTPVAGLTPGTTYYLHVYAEDGIGRGSNVASSAGQTTPAILAPTDINPKSLTLSTLTQLGSTTAFSADQPVDTWSFVGTAPTGLVWEDNLLKVNAALAETTTNFTVRATNVSGSTDQVIDYQVQDGGTAPSADITTTWPGLVTLLNSWGGTVPAGVNVVEVSGNHSGNINLSGVKLDRPVTIRGAGPFNSTRLFNGSYQVTSGAVLSGTLNIGNTENLHLLRIALTGGNNILLAYQDCDNLIEESYFQGGIWNPQAGIYDQVGAMHVVSPGQQGSTNVGVKNLHFYRCFFQFANDKMLYWRTPQNCVVEECTFAWYRADVMRLDTNSPSSIKFIRNWFPRTRNQKGSDPNDDDRAHMDFFQCLNTNLSYIEFYGNVIWQGADSNDPHAYLTHQGFFFGQDTTLANGQVEQNIICTAHQNAIFGPRNPSATRLHLKENSVFRVKATHQGNSQTGLSPRALYYTSTEGNFGAGRADGAGWVGAGGLYITNQTTQEASNDFDFDELLGAGMTGIPETGKYDFGVFRPVDDTSRLHWENANPVGAADRLREIFEDHWHPQKWPCVHPWKEDYDRDNTIWPAITGYGPQGEGITA